MSLCLNCVLFTIKGKDVKTNKYVPIFYMWLSQLILNGGLQNEDALHIYIDSDTMDYLKTETIFHPLIKKLKCKINIFVHAPPTTVFEGYMLRYAQHDCVQSIYMYCDIDILIVKSLHSLIESGTEKTIFLHQEHFLTADPYYHGKAFTKEELEKIPKDSPGFSSGKFIICGKELRKELLKNIWAQNMKENDTWTGDQPVFNKAVYCLNPSLYTKIDIELLKNPIISTNLMGYEKDKAVFLDFMGKAGDGEFHYDKILNHYILLQTCAL